MDGRGDLQGLWQRWFHPRRQNADGTSASCGIDVGDRIRPDEFDIDHVVCGDKRCVNPDHLELVTTRVNLWRQHDTRWADLMPSLLLRIYLHAAEHGELIPMRDVPDLVGLNPRSLRRVMSGGELKQTVLGHNNRYIHVDDLADFVTNRALEDAGLPVLQHIQQQIEGCVAA